MAEGSERKGRFDDLFDDIDRFFVPDIEEPPAGNRRQEGESTDPGHESGAPGGGGDEAVGRGVDPGDEAERGPDAERDQQGPGLESELLPSDWLPDVEELELPEELREELPEVPEQQPEDGSEIVVAPDPAPEGPSETESPEDVETPEWRPHVTAMGREGPRRAEPPRRSEEGQEPEEAMEPAGEADRATEGPPPPTGEEPTRDLGTDDWSRLREVLGEEEEDQEVSFPTEEPTGTETEESLFDMKSLREAGSAAGPPEEPADEPEEPVGAPDRGATRAPGGWDDISFQGPAWAGPGDESLEETGPLLSSEVQSQELSPEDLRKPPPEYRDLPAAEPDEEGEAMVVGEVPPSERESESPRPVPRAFWEDEELSEIERTADEVAGEFAETSDVEEDLLADLDRPARPRTVRVGEPETLAGPSWEEPASRPLIPEPSAPMGGRNIPAALLSAIGLAALALLALAWRPAAFAIVASGVALVGQAELYFTMRGRGVQPATALGLVVGGLTLAAAYLKGEPGMLLFVAIGVVSSFLWYMAVPPKAREGTLANIGATALGIVYVPLLAGYLLIVLSLDNSGRALMLAVLGLTFFYDVVAFMVGSVWGSRPLAPAISPKKSREGLIGASFATLIVGAAIVPLFIDMLSVGSATGLAVIVMVFAPLGDLAESLIKRDLGVKDMGSVLPGHGGALDRIDSVLFVAPAAFYYFRLIF